MMPSNMSRTPSSSRHRVACGRVDAVNTPAFRHGRVQRLEHRAQRADRVRCACKGMSCEYSRYSSSTFSSMIFSSCIPRRHVPYFLYSVPFAHGQALGAERFDLRRAVSAICQSFLYRHAVEEDHRRSRGRAGRFGDGGLRHRGRGGARLGSGDATVRRVIGRRSKVREGDARHHAALEHVPRALAKSADRRANVVETSGRTQTCAKEPKRLMARDARSHDRAL